MPNLRGKTWTTTTPANVEDAQYWEDHLISDTAAAKAASSVQSVNSITPDQYGNVEIGNAGHTIQDDDGNDMPKQDVLQFVNADVTNDTVNEKTVVDCKGAKGDAATVTVGTVTTLPAGSDATVTNSGTSHAAVFNFGIPKGADGTGSVDSVNGYTGTVVLDASDVGALPDSTTIPTKTSELDNDSGFVTSSAIPTSLSELSDDSTHRLVTDAEKTAWDAKVSEPLLKDTVGWIGNNLADMSKVEIGINASGTANTKKARLIMPCESSKTYYVSANGTNRFTSVQFLTTATIPPDFPILEGGSLPYSIDTRSTDKYIIFQFNKETDVTQDDINVLKFMVSETNGDVYNPYHPSVEQCKFDRAEQRVLGAYNLCDVSNASNATNFVSALDTDGTIHFKDVSSVGWSSTYIGKINIVEGVKYKISAHDNAIKYGRVGMSKSATAIPSSSTYPNITVDANTGNPSAPNILLPYTKDNSFVANETATVYLWFANDVETASHATFDVKISLVVVSSSNEVPPYAMTNKELTNNIKLLQKIAGNVYSKYQGSDNKAHTVDFKFPNIYPNLFLIIGRDESWAGYMIIVREWNTSIAAVKVFEGTTAGTPISDTLTFTYVNTKEFTVHTSHIGGVRYYMFSSQEPTISITYDS